MILTSPDANRPRAIGGGVCEMAPLSVSRLATFVKRFPHIKGNWSNEGILL